jgi:hypothetical protein
LACPDTVEEVFGALPWQNATSGLGRKSTPDSGHSQRSASGQNGALPVTGKNVTVK